MLAAMGLDTRDYVTAVLAGLVVVCATLLVEKCGGVVGGVLGMLPHVAVFGSIAFFVHADADDGVFLEGTLSMPLGMLSNALLQAALRTVALRSAAVQQLAALPPPQRLLVVVACGLCAYFASAAVLVRIFVHRRDAAWLWGVGGASFGAHALLGLAMLHEFVPAPRGCNKSHWSSILLRGSVTAAIFLLAMHIADSFPAVAGMLVNFPFVTIAMVSTLWLQQGEAVAVGALSPMALGMLSASAYALLAADLMPRLANVAQGAAVAWFTAVTAVSVPLTVALRRLHRDRERGAETPAPTPTAAGPADTGSGDSCKAEDGDGEVSEIVHQPAAAAVAV